MLDTTHAAALRRRILEAVDAEVDRADDIHGDRSISHLGPDERFLALAALTEEVGELARALIDTADAPAEVGGALVEAVQVAASAVALTYNLAAPNERHSPGLFAALFDLPPNLSSTPFGKSESVFLEEDADPRRWTATAKTMASRLTGDERLSESFYRMAVPAVVGLVPTLPTWGSELLLTRSQALQVIGLIAIETLISEGDR